MNNLTILDLYLKDVIFNRGIEIWRIDEPADILQMGIFFIKKYIKLTFEFLRLRRVNKFYLSGGFPPYCLQMTDHFDNFRASF